MKPKANVCSTCGTTKVNYYGLRCFSCEKPEPKLVFNIHEVCYYVSIKNGLKPDTIMNYIGDLLDVEANDSFVGLPSIEETDEDSTLKQYLQMIDKEFPSEKSDFYISW